MLRRDKENLLIGNYSENQTVACLLKGAAAPNSIAANEAARMPKRFYFCIM